MGSKKIIPRAKKKKKKIMQPDSASSNEHLQK